MRGVLASWGAARAREYRRLHGLAETPGTAVTVQRMVYGNAGGTSGAGVAFTRDPASGARALYLDFLFNAQGEDVVSGRASASDAGLLAALMPELYAEIEATARLLEQEFRDLQEFEFTVQDARLHLLQTRTGKCTPWAALQIAADMVEERLIDPATALRRLAPVAVERLERTRVVRLAGSRVLGRGTPASLGAAVGRIVFDPERAQRRAAAGWPVILVRETTATEDLGGLAAASGILTAAGGRTAHAAVVARELDKACIVGCAALRIEQAARRCTIGDVSLAEGDEICLDGAAGEVLLGPLEVVNERPEALLARYREWAAAAG